MRIQGFHCHRKIAEHQMTIPRANDAMQTRPSFPKVCIFASEQGGFLPEMTKREAAQILGTREGAREDKIREAHLRIMKANHPDLGGSSYLAEKVNEAKDMLLGKSKRRTSAF